MARFQVPPERVYNSAFAERGREGVVKIEALPIRGGEQIRLRFESVDSPWRQGVWMVTQGHLIVNNQASSAMEIWQDTAPSEIPIECRTLSGILHLYNIWDRQGRRNSLSWSSGMLVQDLPNGRRYHCNDIGFDTEFNKLVFCVQREPLAHKSR